MRITRDMDVTECERCGTPEVRDEHGKSNLQQFDDGQVCCPKCLLERAGQQTLGLDV